MTDEHSMQFRGTVDKQPVKILLDTGASGNAFIDLQHCKDENITMYPAPPGIHIVFGNSSKVQATNFDEFASPGITVKFIHSYQALTRQKHIANTQLHTHLTPIIIVFSI